MPVPSIYSIYLYVVLVLLAGAYIYRQYYRGATTVLASSRRAVRYSSTTYFGLFRGIRKPQADRSLLSRSQPPAGFDAGGSGYFSTSRARSALRGREQGNRPLPKPSPPNLSPGQASSFRARGLKPLSPAFLIYDRCSRSSIATSGPRASMGGYLGPLAGAEPYGLRIRVVCAWYVWHIFPGLLGAVLYRSCTAPQNGRL